MKPTQEQIDKVVAESREPCIVQGDGFAFEAMDYYGSVIAALADQLADAQRTAAQAVARVRELEGEVAYVREHALPLPLTPWAGPATGNDMVDRLRGIYVMPVIGERRFGASAINLEAAARLEEHAILTASAGKETDRG